MEQSWSIDQSPAISHLLGATPSKDGSSLSPDLSVLSSLADFPCTHRRIRGRLYATADAVFFYSNLLGFETRITVLLADILALELCRTTSIELHLCDGEVYTFKSFQDRERVLQVIMTLKAADDARRDTIHGLSTPRTTPSQLRRVRNQASDPTALATMRAALSPSSSTPVLKSYASNDDFEESSVSSLATPIHSNRQRAASENNAYRLSEATVLRFDTTPERQILHDSSPPDGEVSSEANTPLSCDQNGPVDAEIERRWRDASRMEHAIGSENVGIDKLLIPCDLETFVKKFLADDASHSLDKFQQEAMGDSDLHITPWVKEDADDSVSSRTMTFVHPIKNSMGMGPSEARTTRVQRMRRYGRLGLTLENTTHVIGIPAADSFFIRDHWLLESMPGGDQVRLTTRFGTHFHKRSLLKSFIEKSIVSQTTDWFSGYATMLTKALADGSADVRVTDKTESILEPSQTATLKAADQGSTELLLRRLSLMVVWMSLAILVMLVQLFVLGWTIFRLRAEVRGLAQDLLFLSRGDYVKRIQEY